VFLLGHPIGADSWTRLEQGSKRAGSPPMVSIQDSSLSPAVPPEPARARARPRLVVNVPDSVPPLAASPALASLHGEVPALPLHGSDTVPLVSLMAWRQEVTSSRSHGYATRLRLSAAVAAGEEVGLRLSAALAAREEATKMEDECRLQCDLAAQRELVAKKTYVSLLGEVMAETDPRA
jgi:hypothetical protein